MENTLSERKYIISGIFVLIGIIYLVRLFSLQLIDTSFRASAENNARRDVTQYPARGLVYDRKGILLVDNEASYDLMLIPNQLKNLDTAALCKGIGISVEQIGIEIDKAKKYSFYIPSVIVKQLSSRAYASLQEKLYKFSGFSVQIRTLRKYPKQIEAHVHQLLRLPDGCFPLLFVLL